MTLSNLEESKRTHNETVTVGRKVDLIKQFVTYIQFNSIFFQFNFILKTHRQTAVSVAHRVNMYVDKQSSLL